MDIWSDPAKQHSYFIGAFIGDMITQRQSHSWFWAHPGVGWRHRVPSVNHPTMPSCARKHSIKGDTSEREGRGKHIGCSAQQRPTTASAFCACHPPLNPPSAQISKCYEKNIREHMILSRLYTESLPKREMDDALSFLKEGHNISRMNKWKYKYFKVQIIRKANLTPSPWKNIQCSDL